jgi:hypothetical protein
VVVAVREDVEVAPAVWLVVAVKAARAEASLVRKKIKAAPAASSRKMTPPLRAV